MTPEDTILNVLLRYFKKEDIRDIFSAAKTQERKHEIVVYDMVASSGANWFVFGVEVGWGPWAKVPGADEPKPDFVFLDSHQITEVPSKAQFLPTQSEVASLSKNGNFSRFNIKVMLDKNYVISSRYVYMMAIDRLNKSYQYVMIDLLPYINSLKERGFDL